MPRTALFVLVLFAFLLFIVGLAAGDIAVIVIGLVFTAILLFVALIPGGVLRKEQVLERWSALIEGGKGKAEEVFTDTQRFIQESEAPAISLKRDNMLPTFWGWKEREFLILTEEGNDRLKPYQMFFNCRDYGNQLAIDWYITYRPGFFQALFANDPLARLDLFDQQDLTAYATNAHHCLIKSVEKLMLSLNQDPQKLNRASKGILGIS